MKRKLTVDGGPQQNILSEFDGPVVFNKKITSTTDEGIESNSIFLQGDATVSRKYTVGIATPTVAETLVMWSTMLHHLRVAH